MWCEMNPEDLDAFVDGEVSEPRAREIAAHVGACPSCRATLERNRRVDDAIRRHDPVWEITAMRADLMRRVGPSTGTRVLRVAAGIAVAILAFLVGLHYTSSSTTSSPEVTPPRHPSDGPPQIQALELDAASLRLALAAEKPDPALREDLDARLDAIVNDIEKLRATARLSK